MDTVPGNVLNLHMRFTRCLVARLRHDVVDCMKSSDIFMRTAVKLKYEDGLQMSDGSKDTASYHNRQQTTLVRLVRWGLMSPISRNRTAQCWVPLLGITGKTRGQQPCLEISVRRVETSETDAASAMLSKLKLVLSLSLHHPGANSLATITFRLCPDGVSSLSSASLLQVQNHNKKQQRQQ